MTKAPIQKKGVEGSVSTCFIKNIEGIADLRWRELIDEQDYEIMILELREDILAKVNYICYKKYLKNEVYKFIAECAQDAFKQIVALHFFNHDDRQKHSTEQESWQPDAEPELCKMDSWAKGNIPYSFEEIPKNKYQQTDAVFSDYQLLKYSEYPAANIYESPSKISVESVVQSTERFPSLVIVPEKEPEISQISVQFTNYGIGFDDEIINVQETSSPNRSISENMFYKIMKMSKISCVSMQSPTKPKIVTPTWLFMDKIENVNKRNISSLKLRRDCYTYADRKLCCKKDISYDFYNYEEK